MERFDVIIVGAGPAGSTCARDLVQAGWRTLVLDKAHFPRDKLCAGWITPEVMTLAGVDRVEYCSEGRNLAPIQSFVVWDGKEKEHKISYDRTVSYGIVRTEFDEFLADRCGAELRYGIKGTDFQRRAGQWVVNGQFEAPVLVGAGGHFCPVARTIGILFRPEPAIGCMEIEVPLSDKDLHHYVRYPDVPEIIFCNDLNGYGWYFNKGNVLNVGLGRYGGKGVRPHLEKLLRQLHKKRKLPAGDTFAMKHFKGHAYKLHKVNPRQRAGPGFLLVGDAAGVAYNVSGEGIYPAILSGKLASTTLIQAQGDYDERLLKTYEHRLDAALGRPLTPQQLRIRSRTPTAAVRALAGTVFQSDFLVRKLIVEYLFLRAREKGGHGNHFCLNQEAQESNG